MAYEKITFLCEKHGNVDHYVTKHGGSTRIRCTRCNVEAVQKRRDELKVLALNYKGGKCECCGYDKCASALEFHHKDPAQKDFGIGQNGYTRSWEKVKIELDKCVLVCANCHREIHAGVRILVE